MGISKHIEYWIESAESDIATAERLFISGDYHWCLFIAHLVIEKALKAYYCKFKGDIPPRSHDLVELANKSDLVLSPE